MSRYFLQFNHVMLLKLHLAVQFVPTKGLHTRNQLRLGREDETHSLLLTAPTCLLSDSLPRKISLGCHGRALGRVQVVCI